MSRLENIRSTLKNTDPSDIILADIRDRLGPILADLEILASLRQPDSCKMTRLHGKDAGVVRVEIVMDLDESEAEDLVRKLWLDQ